MSNFQNLKGSNTEVSLKNLKEYLYSIPHTKSVELLCLDNCMRCSVLVDSKEYNSTSAFDDIIDDSIRVYRYDFYTGIQEQSQKVHFNSENVQENVCFSYSVDKKGVGDQVIVEFKERVYDFSTHLSSSTVYSSLQEMAKSKESLTQEVLR
ncbi:hypothetical protein [Candidatus Sulfurimonas marisnigri]|uniref:hypothetical protein n=1 Tax=Candidatus Sulfurimonas marisnigri TaxID=2740405 RepID=UPI001E484C99|nr:hypothetical protein [Candidatus Sulfurimonas marisnigri]